MPETERDRDRAGDQVRAAVVGQCQGTGREAAGLIGTLKVTSTVETGVFRGSGETAAIEVMVSGERIWMVAWAEVGVGWTLPALSVATL